MLIFWRSALSSDEINLSRFPKSRECTENVQTAHVGFLLVKTKKWL